MICVADHTARPREENRTPLEALAVGLDACGYCVSGLRTLDHHHPHVASCRVVCVGRCRARKVPAGWNVLSGAGYVGGIAHLVRSSRAGGGAACSPGLFQPAGSPQIVLRCKPGRLSACRAADPPQAFPRPVAAIGSHGGEGVRTAGWKAHAIHRSIMRSTDFTQRDRSAFTHATSPFDFPNERILCDTVTRHESSRSRSVRFSDEP